MPVSWLRRSTNFPSGIAAGGGDTGFDLQSQRTILTVRVTDARKTFTLPAGTVLVANVLMPDASNPATTGDWQIDRITGGSNAELAASAAETPIITVRSPMVLLDVDTEYEVKPTNNPDGVTHVGFEVILPRMRP